MTRETAATIFFALFVGAIVLGLAEVVLVIMRGRKAPAFVPHEITATHVDRSGREVTDHPGDVVDTGSSALGGEHEQTQAELDAKKGGERA